MTTPTTKSKEDTFLDAYLQPNPPAAIDHAGRVKPNYKIRDVKLVPAPKLWPNNPGLKGKFIVQGTQVWADPDKPAYAEQPIRTSLIVKVDIEAGTIETLNSTYHIVL